MDWYRVRYKTESWLASAWQADTIWGHLCWGIRYTSGQPELARFLERYQQGDPPILLSNGFPEDMLPRPIMPPPPADPNCSVKARRDESRANKDVKGVRWLTETEFNKVLRMERFTLSVKDRIEIVSVTLKNQIDRGTGTTGGGESGHLFPFEQYRWDSVTIYVKIADYFVKTAEELFSYIAQTGYGKRKSVGYGQVKLDSFEGFSGFDSPANANGFVSLSNYVPAAEDPQRGHWDIIVKYGKLGEEFASESPFKKPLIMFAAGSTFYDSPPKNHYGRIIDGLAPAHSERIVQYGFALPVPMKLPEPDETQ